MSAVRKDLKRAANHTCSESPSVHRGWCMESLGAWSLVAFAGSRLAVIWGGGAVDWRLRRAVHWWWRTVVWGLWRGWWWRAVDWGLRRGWWWRAVVWRFWRGWRWRAVVWRFWRGWWWRAVDWGLRRVWRRTVVWGFGRVTWRAVDWRFRWGWRSPAAAVVIFGLFVIITTSLIIRIAMMMIIIMLLAMVEESMTVTRVMIIMLVMVVKESSTSTQVLLGTLQEASPAWPLRLLQNPTTGTHDGDHHQQQYHEVYSCNLHFHLSQIRSLQLKNQTNQTAAAAGSS